VVTETGICLNFEGWMSEDMMQKIAGIMPPNEENGLDMLCGFDYNEVLIVIDIHGLVDAKSYKYIHSQLTLC
jgi:hypothetical protein